MATQPTMGISNIRYPTVLGKVKPFGFEQVTSIGTVTALGLSHAARLTAAYAIIQALNANTRYRDDGTGPTTSAGMPLYAASSLAYAGDLSQIKFVAETGTAEVNVLYYGYG